MVAKNAIVNWLLNFRVSMLMKSAVRTRLHYLTSVQTGPQISLLFEEKRKKKLFHKI